MAPAARQIQSLCATGTKVDILQMRGPAKVKYPLALSRVRRMARHVDVIHAHFGFCGWLARSQVQRPIVVSFMGDDLLGTPRANGSVDWFSRLMVQANRRLAGWVDAVIVKSAEMAEVVAPVSAHIVPNGVNLDMFTPMDVRAARSTLGWNQDKNYILFPGDPQNPRKGYPLAEETVRRAEQFIGRPLELVTLWGVAPDQVAVVMNASNAMLMTSLIEGSPNVVKEAMACNLPVVGVPVGDVPTMLDGVAGNFVGPRDSDRLGKALGTLVAGQATSEGRAALQQRGLDLSSVAEKILGIYHSVLN